MKALLSSLLWVMIISICLGNTFSTIDKHSDLLEDLSKYILPHTCVGILLCIFHSKSKHQKRLLKHFHAQVHVLLKDQRKLLLQNHLAFLHLSHHVGRPNFHLPNLRVLRQLSQPDGQLLQRVDVLLRSQRENHRSIPHADRQQQLQQNNLLTFQQSFLLNILLLIQLLSRRGKTLIMMKIKQLMEKQILLH